MLSFQKRFLTYHDFSSPCFPPHARSVLLCDFSFCQGSDESILIPYAPRIAKDLGPFLSVTSEDTLSLVLEALSVVLEVENGKWLTAELASALVVASLEVWHKNNRGSWNPNS